MTLGRSDAHWDDFEIERQLRFLASVSEELSATDDWSAALIRVARGVVDDGLATACVIEVLGESGPVQVAIADVDPAREPVLATIFSRTDPGASEDGPRRLALRSGQAQLINDIGPEFWARIAYDDAHRAALESLQVRSIISVPMAARGRLVGVVTLGHTRQPFAAAHLAVAQDLAGRVGLAVDNARLRQAAEEALAAREHSVAQLELERQSEQQARREAERSAAQLVRLQAITARLSRARTVAEVADVVVADAPAGVGAANASLSLIDDTGDHLELVREGGYDTAVAAHFRRFAVAEALPAPDAVRSRRPVLLGSIQERDERYPQLRGTPTANHSFAILPVSVDDRVLGAIAFSWPEDREFPDEAVRFMAAVADQCAQALDRARLLEADRGYAQRQAFLAEASRLLAASLDAERTLTQLVRIIVPQLADAAAVHFYEGGRLRLVAAANSDSAREAVTIDVGRRTAPNDAGRSVFLEVAQSGQAIVAETVSPDDLSELAHDAGHLAKLHELDVRSAVLLPLTARERVIGVLTMTVGPSGRRYRQSDLSVMEDLGSRAAAAIDNAQTHRTQRDAAVTLQQSLMPPALPAVPGLDIASRYHPVADGSRVGGDFFDVFSAGDGRWAVVMGDVCGQGVPAATLTAMARWTTRVAATQEDRPSDVLRRVNATVLGADIGERFCTLVLAFVEPRAGGARVTLTCGGHPLPFLLAGEKVTAVGTPGMVIGLFPEPDLADTELWLAPGEGLLLYTDGVTEARSMTGEFRPDLLPTVLADARDRTPEGLVDAVDRAVLQFEGGEPRDDMALLAFMVPPAATT